MTNYFKLMISLVIMMVAITAIVIWNIQERFFKPEQLTIQEASAKVEKLYGGTIESFEQKGNIFYLTLQRQEKAYDLQIDMNTGNITKMNLAIVENTDEPATQLKTKKEIQALFQNKGTIQSITLQQSEVPTYKIEITENETLKIVTVNAKTGEVLSEQVKQQNNTKNETIISKNQAKNIALSQLKGKVEYIIFEESSNGGYYLIEIETEEKSSTFQIHAISGKILSVTHEKDDDEDDEDDDEDD
ncbi:PepSY domain-containing protein [Ureibacillus endophyticus]|uniref:PepSY domain-containing protein n=1 Tax=Ureibacillus endophyticus TaxID=1978490 RepID=A0A494Z1T4_9BACL|nr:PepSY domain-containing protein [Lysinibacillus endophyticus]RKQ16435.1 hypothetical protein D8M03_10085 [Lysinibacillus endophyticus]